MKGYVNKQLLARYSNYSKAVNRNLEHKLNVQIEHKNVHCAADFRFLITQRKEKTTKSTKDNFRVYFIHLHSLLFPLPCKSKDTDF